MRKFCVLILFILIFMSISCVAAQDNVNSTVNSTDISPDSTCEPGTFDDLKNDIQNLNQGDVYEINQDYVFSRIETPQSSDVEIRNELINIKADNVTINGNGHYIDGHHRTALFNVTGNNVRILNLTIINCEDVCYKLYSDDDFAMMGNIIGKKLNLTSPINSNLSPICWYGDNGLMSDCIFTGNTAKKGGAMTWKGNNGRIENCQFINNTATGVGGALYIGGENNTVCNSTFSNCVSQLSGESIYLDRSRKNITVKNLTYDHLLFIDGQISNISTDDLCFSQWVNIGPNEVDENTKEYANVDIIPLLYKSITLGGVNYINGNMTYYFCSYNNASREFTLNVCTDFGEKMNYYAGTVYTKIFTFKNISDFSQVITDAFYGNYTTSVVQIGTVYVSNDVEYVNVLKGVNYPHFFERAPGEMRELNVVFTKHLFFESIGCFHVDDFDCDIINLYGNGSVIKATTGDRDEYTWITNTKTIFIASDIKIEGFNIAIENKGGTVILNNVVLKDNRMDYIMDPDWGAGIQNTGYCICNNCTFADNYCSRGGAIFNVGRLELNNCTFTDNTAYTEGNDVLNVGDGVVILNGEKITGDEGPITYTGTVMTVSKVVTMVTFTVSIVVSLFGLLIAIAIDCLPLFLGIAATNLALMGALVIFTGEYTVPREDIVNYGHPNISPIDITVPIKITDEIIFN